MVHAAAAVLPLLAVVVSAQQELLQNPGFESPLAGHWEGTGFTISRSSDAHSGSYSLKSSGRMRNQYQGPGQLVNLKPGKMYKFSVYIKQLNDMPGKTSQKYRANVGFTWKDDGHVFQLNVAYHTSVRSADGWFRVAGYFRAPTREFVSAKLHIQSPDIGIDFLLDDTSLVELSDLSDWKQEADQRIKQLRMGDIHFRFNLSSDVSVDEIDIQIDHTKHLFGFGTLVKDQWMVDHNHKQYQDMVYDYFNTATTQGVKWLFDKGSQGHPNYDQAVACIDALKQKRMRVRAHNLFWGFTKNLPQYVQHMSVAHLNTTVQERLRYMVSLVKGKVDHWDVMNELVHGQWFEEQFHDPSYSEKLFTQVHQLDPDSVLMLNDFGVIARPEITDAYLQQAQRFLSHGAPVQGLGVQGHFHSSVPDPQLIMLNLDHVAQAGLPIWVTELDVWQQDPDVRADYYDTVLRVFFSHPAVEGIVFWGFWDQHVVNKTSSLVDGQHLTINAAGQRYIHLIKEEWSTHINRSLSSGLNFDLRGFKGDYEVNVKRNGVTVKVVPFSLTENNTSVHINVDTNVDVPPPGFIAGGQRDASGRYVMGSASSSSTSPSITCTSYHGHQSVAEDEAVAEVSCHHADEVMTGCSSILKNHDWHREGEQVLTDKGQVICRAVNGVGTSGAVQPVARCCKLSGLSCAYRAAGPSQPGQGATVATECLFNETPLGCAAWGAHNNGGGVLRTNTSCRATNNDLHTGVYSYASCCSAPGLRCVTVTSPGSGLHFGSFYQVQCPSGFTITACNFLSSGGAKGAGAALAGNQACQAFASGSVSQDQAIQAVATCCKVST